MPDQQYVEDHPIDQLVELPDNPRRGDTAMIEQSIAELGFYGACIVERGTNIVLAGNHRLRAAREQGHTTVPVLIVDGTGERGRKIALVDNHANDAATYDVQALLAQLQELGDDLAGTGYTTDDVADLLAVVTLDPPEPGSDGGDDLDAIDDLQDFLSTGTLNIKDVPVELLEAFRAVPGGDDLARLQYLLANVPLPGMPDDEEAADGG